MLRLVVAAAGPLLVLAPGARAQTANGANGGSMVITSPALGGGTTTTNSNGSGTPVVPQSIAGQLSSEIQQLQEQVQELTGQVQVATHQAQVNAAAIKRMQADVDLRFQQLNSAGTPAVGATTGSSAQPPMAAAQQPPMTAAQPPTAAAAPAATVGGNGPTPLAGAGPAGPSQGSGTGLAPGPQILGTIPEKDLKRQEATEPAPEKTQQAAAAPKPVGPVAAYEAAYGLVQHGNYPAAADAFKAFVAKYPHNRLTANARYWQAEMAYVQKDFRQSAGLFAEAYKHYPQSSRAPEMLYKLSESFARLGMNKQACTSLSLLFQEHPGMPSRIRRAADVNKRKLGCH